MRTTSDTLHGESHQWRVLAKTHYPSKGGGFLISQVVETCVMLKPTYQFFNYFVPDVFRVNNALHTQAVILVAVVAFTTAVSLFGLLYIQFGLPGLDEFTRRVGRYFVLFTISVYLIARLFYYRFYMLQTAGHIVTFGLFSSTLGGILVTGGYT